MKKRSYLPKEKEQRYAVATQLAQPAEAEAEARSSWPKVGDRRVDR
jgi:hypothetical protein